MEGLFTSVGLKKSNNKTNHPSFRVSTSTSHPPRHFAGSQQAVHWVWNRSRAKPRADVANGCFLRVEGEPYPADKRGPNGEEELEKGEPI